MEIMVVISQDYCKIKLDLEPTTQDTEHQVLSTAKITAITVSNYLFRRGTLSESALAFIHLNFHAVSNM